MKKLKGIVIRKSAEKTVVVEVKRTVIHKVYKKRLTTFKRYLVHENIPVEVGQSVEISETRPISKRKRWQIQKVY